MWFTETPWPPILILATIACILIGVWGSQKRAIYLGIAAALLVACVAIFFIERAIVTESERLEAEIYKLCWSFQKKDTDATLAAISEQALQVRLIASVAIGAVNVQDDLDVKDISVEFHAENTRAITRFRANASVSSGGTNLGFQPSYIELEWQKEGKDWKVIRFQRLNPINGRPMELFDMRAN